MRVLMLSSPFASHLAPMVPLAWALQAAGHDVMVAGPPDVMDVVHATGLCGVTIGEPVRAAEWLSGHLPEGVRPIQMFGPGTPETLESGVKLWLAHARDALPGYLALARCRRPDLIVVDPLEFAGAAIAGTLGVPYVQHRWGIELLGHLAWRFAGEFFDGPLPPPALIIDPAPPELQTPGLPPARTIRHIPVNGTAPAPAWIGDRPASRRVCVSLGRQTALMGGLPLFRNLIAAFDGLPDVEAVVTADPEHHATLGPVPRTVKVVPPTPLDLFLHSCDAIVHHGGASTTLTAIGFGLPHLVLPQVSDEFAVGRRLAGTGAALTIEDHRRQDDPARVRSALRTLLDDDAHTRAAARLRRSQQAMPPPSAAVPLLEALVLKAMN
ncbi:nucleotide disphospho-sugar-binding domain-containing protein [Actinoallomurus sp. CA-150999]|uniref:nucleotide disphospho-sugar-binding domain-containing protein n=1 Tax=Actinoallomurus sp. CA-150999 TaxID=3239887 RepID=UPI003D8B1E11